MKKERILTDNWFLRESESTEVMKIPQMPMQVHDILYHYGKIGDSYQWGNIHFAGQITVMMSACCFLIYLDFSKRIQPFQQQNILPTV